MKIAILLILSMCAIAQCHYMETDMPYTDENDLPEQADYLKDTHWIKYGNGIEMNASSIINDCATYSNQVEPSVCPEGKEYHSGFCVLKCPETYTRMSTCACKSPEGKTFDDCVRFGDAKAQGYEGGPVCRSDQETWGIHCYPVRCPAGYSRITSCGCAILRRVRTRST